MILPSKNITLQYSIFGMGAKILTEVNIPQTVSSLWEKVRNYEEINTYDKYVLTLDFLYSIGLIELEKGIIQKVVK